MRRKSVRILLLVLLMIGATLGSASQVAGVQREDSEPLADASLEAAAIQLAIDFSVPVPIARDRMSRQMPLMELVESASEATGAAWADAWFDHAGDGDLVVQATNIDALARWKAGIANQELAQYITVRNAAFSNEELTAQIPRVQAALESLQVPLTSAVLRADLNAVQIGIPPDDELESRGLRPVDVLANVQTIMDQYPGMILERVPTDVPPDACRTDHQVCGSPMRGGLELVRGTTGCTAGFIVIGNTSGTPYVLTTGHCMAAVDEKWASAKTGSHTGIVIGKTYKFTAETDFAHTIKDYGIIKITGEWQNANTVLVTAKTQTVDGTTYTTTRDESYTISSTAGTHQALVNGYACKTGAITGTSCGPYIGINTVNGLGRIRLNSCSGDSGAPVFIGHVGYGMHHRHIPQGVNVQTRTFWTKSLSWSVDCYSWAHDDIHGYSMYQGLTAALTARNVHLKP